MCFPAFVSYVLATVDPGTWVCGLEDDSFSDWGGGMAASSGWVDVLGCGGPISDSGGGGGGGDVCGSGDGDGGGGGDGVGEWSGVMGLGEVWLSGGLSGWWCEFTSKGISASVGAVTGRSAWGMGLAGAIVEDRCPVT